MSGLPADFSFDQFLHSSDGEQVLAADVIESLIELGGGHELVLELVDLYLEDSTGRVDSVIAGARSGDLNISSAAAHALKSASANMGALQFSELCKNIEHSSKEGDEKVVAELAAQIELMYQEVEQALASLSRSFQPDAA